MDRIITEKRPLSIRMTDGYGIVHDYQCKDECPLCHTKIVIEAENSGCYDGEYTYTHQFTCENKCNIAYSVMRKFNGYED